MNINIKQHKLYTALVISLVLVFTVATALIHAILQGAAIRITSPHDGAVITAGEPLVVSIEPVGAVSLQEVSAWILPVSEVPQIDNQSPFHVTVHSLPDILGEATLEAVALDSGGNRLSTTIRVIVRAPSVPVDLTVHPNPILLREIGQIKSIQVDGIFVDNVLRELTNLPDTIFSIENSRVAAMDGRGVVRAVGPGLTNVVVRHAGLSKVVPLRVAVFELRGDLDGDTDVDQSDLNILIAARNTKATGGGDPRDLNNDGAIDALDSRVLVNLCSRPRCLVQ
jgi:hypothetical protein